MNELDERIVSKDELYTLQMQDAYESMNTIPPYWYRCGYCMSNIGNDTGKKMCCHCGALLSAGYLYAGTMNGKLIAIKVSDL